MLRLCEMLALILYWVVFISQVALPLVRGTPLFPFFRKERGLSIRLAEERQRLVEKQLQEQIRKMK